MITRALVVLATLMAAPSALAASDLRTTMTVSPVTTLVYNNATYTVAVKNIGNQSASNCSVVINLPATHTSPQVYVLGNLGSRSASCAQSGTRLTCTLGSISRNATKTVFFNIGLPVSAAPLTFVATASTTSTENTLTNNSATMNASQSFYNTPVNAVPGTPVTMNNRHCTGTGLTAWMECTFFPSSIASHQAEFHDDGTITIPGQPAYSGEWTLTTTANGNSLYFYYDDGTGVVIEFNGWGADANCFEGLSTFPGSSYVSPYEVCPL